MIFTIRKASYFPIVLEPEEEHSLQVLEEQGRWTELEELEKDLRHSLSLKELRVEAERLDEVYLLLTSINSLHPITVDFQKKTIIIEDNGLSIS